MSKIRFSLRICQGLTAIQASDATELKVLYSSSPLYFPGNQYLAAAHIRCRQGETSGRLHYLDDGGLKLKIFQMTFYNLCKTWHPANFVSHEHWERGYLYNHSDWDKKRLFRKACITIEMYPMASPKCEKDSCIFVFTPSEFFDCLRNQKNRKAPLSEGFDGETSHPTGFADTSREMYRHHSIGLESSLD